MKGLIGMAHAIEQHMIKVQGTLSKPSRMDHAHLEEYEHLLADSMKIRGVLMLLIRGLRYTTSLQRQVAKQDTAKWMRENERRERAAETPAMRQERRQAIRDSMGD